jgi:zinc/manganese transport system substrate-binding protein
MYYEGMPMRALLLLTLCLAAIAGEAMPLRVVSTTTVLADIVRQIGGGRVESLSLLKPGTDAHTYQPTPDDVRLIASARLVVVNGLGFEGWIDQLIAAAGGQRPVVVASAGVEPMSAGERDEGGAGHQHTHGADPHAWQDAKNGMLFVANIRAALTAADPAGADDYAAWADAYAAQLRVVDAWIRKQISQLPAERRVLVTSHDALGYFGRAYGMEVVPVEGIATGQEPDPARVVALIALLRQRQVKAVFIENVANPKVVERLGAEGGAHLGGSLYTDSLDLPGRPAGTYIGMFLANVRTIVGGLK